MMFAVRAEQPGDEAAIHAVTLAAFRDAAHTSHTEQFIVDALRAAGALTISLVATEPAAGGVIGHVALSPVAIEANAVAPDAVGQWFGLGPISVLPDHQRRGVGSALMGAALAELEASGAAGCVLVGDPAYYVRFGFTLAAPLVLPGVPPEYVQALALRGAVPAGRMRFHGAFEATS